MSTRIAFTRRQPTPLGAVAAAGIENPYYWWRS
jgi:hypothetical protein